MRQSEAGALPRMIASRPPRSKVSQSFVALTPKANAESANTMIIAANATLAAVEPASVEITPMPMTGSAFPQNTQMR